MVVWIVPDGRLRDEMNTGTVSQPRTVDAGASVAPLSSTSHSGNA